MATKAGKSKGSSDAERIAAILEPILNDAYTQGYICGWDQEGECLREAAREAARVVLQNTGNP